MNVYARLSEMRRDLNVIRSDEELLALAERVSRAIDQQCGRTFFWQPGQTRHYRASGGRDLCLYDDVLSVSELAVDVSGDGSFGLVLTEGTDYWLEPERVNPKRVVVLTGRGQLGSWPIGRRVVRITGDFGYTNETVIAGTLAAAIDGTADTITVGGDVSAGDTLVIGSEHMYVRHATSGTVSVIRGVNGSPVSEHVEGATVRRVVYPADLVQAVTMQVSRLQIDTHTGFSGNVGPSEFAGMAFASTYPAIRDLLAPFRVPVVV